MQAIGRDQTVDEVAAMIHKVKVGRMEEKGILPQDMPKEEEEELDEDEFIKLIGEEYAISGKREELEDAYHEFNPDERGITKEGLAEVMEEHGQKIEGEELDKLFKESDHDNDGRINFDDFVRSFMTRT